MDTDRQTLRETFNRAADLYDEMRPGYPDPLIEDLIQISGIPRGGAILEIGCGTGQATEPFAERGYAMLCLDIGSNLAALASRKFAHLDNVTVLVESFEAWSPGIREFDLVIAATSFRWVAREVRYAKAADVLKPTGSLAVFFNRHVRKDEGFFAEVQSVYRACAPSLGGSSTGVDELTTEETGIDRFEAPIQRIYPWSTEYDAGSYIKLLSTYSGHINLPPNEREALFSGIRHLINQKYSGKVTKHYEAVLELRRRRM